MLSQRSISCDSCSDRIDEIDQNAFDIICSVPGKVILHGEHAVVYGKVIIQLLNQKIHFIFFQSAVAVSVDLRTTVEIKLGGNDVQIKLADLNADQIWPFSSFERIRLVNDVDEKSPKNFELTETLLDKIKPFIDDMHFDAFYPYGHNHHDPKKKSEEEESKFSITQINNSLKAFLLLYLGISDVYRSSQHVPLRIIVTSTLPCGAGLGSSSAFSVSLTAALFKAYNVKASDEIISDWAYQIDKLFHGKPSGIDNSICTFGGALLFRNGKIEKQLTNIPQFEVILVNTKVARNTKSLVQKAKDQYDKYPLVYDNILAAIDEVSKSAWSLFEDKNDNSKNIGKFKVRNLLFNFQIFNSNSFFRNFSKSISYY